MAKGKNQNWSDKKLNLMVTWEGTLKNTIIQVEKQLIKLALRELKTKTKVAEVLGVNRMTILRKLKK